MYKNQLQELAQRSCFNLPSYTCIREGPDHAPRFKATVNFNGEIFECPHYCSTLRQAEHSAAEVALTSLSNRGPSHSLAARILDETGVYKNLLQEIAQRVGAPLPQYTTFRSGLGHQPVFTGTVELAGITFTGEPAKNKKQAEKNAAMAAWSSLKQLAKEDASSSSEPENSDELEQITIARALLNYRLKEKMAIANSPNSPIPFSKKFPMQGPRPTSPQPVPATTSKILPLFCPKTTRNRPTSTTITDRSVPTRTATSTTSCDRTVPPRQSPTLDFGSSSSEIPAAEQLLCPYPTIGRMPWHGSPVRVRSVVPVFAAPQCQPPSLPPQVLRGLPQQPPPVTIRQTSLVYAASPPVQKEDPLNVQKGNVVVPKEDSPASQKEHPDIGIEDSPTVKKEHSAVQKADSQAGQTDNPAVEVEDPLCNTKEDQAAENPNKSPAQLEEASTSTNKSLQESAMLQSLEHLKI
ncbi:double-stranded RNA binding protein, putative [Ricinus communis]|uniref:Double-stranded RNA binding protein, putative n=1 Tax=Ricinus communis TaxID=3988 RepID=B9SVC8_RICCO|nr:double-stranded RNA binding protein, putative [Ricinus communis]|eukprot:XP_002529947.1 double-stranded RNA-binding protein 2 [Ricinus communis]